VSPLKSCNSSILARERATTLHTKTTTVRYRYYVRVKAAKIKLFTKNFVFSKKGTVDENKIYIISVPRSLIFSLNSESGHATIAAKFKNCAER